MKVDRIARVLGYLVMVLLLGAVALLVMSDRPTQINTEYGKRRGLYADSVNGIAAFSRMFEDQGARVRTGTRLSPSLARSQVIVWAPNSFELPRTTEIDFFETEWLGKDDGTQRTLVYIARDYQAALEYWRHQRDTAKGTSFIESQRQLARSQTEHAYMRSLTGIELDCEWFSMKNRNHVFHVQPTEGPWSQLIDADQAPWQVSCSLEPESDAETTTSRVLLGSQETPLIVELTDAYRWRDGRVLVLVNGAATLNLGLVNHENRKLAGQLIDYCGSPRRVTFLESGPMGLTVSKTRKKAYSGFEALTVWPINVILLHLIAAGILYCVMVYPIFGRPRELSEDSPSHFGKHIAAIQRLLELSKNREQAIARVNEYRELEGDIVTKPTTSTETGNPFKVSQA